MYHNKIASHGVNLVYGLKDMVYVHGPRELNKTIQTHIDQIRQRLKKLTYSTDMQFEALFWPHLTFN